MHLLEGKGVWKPGNPLVNRQNGGNTAVFVPSERILGIQGKS
jgi:hypothetical protein